MDTQGRKGYPNDWTNSLSVSLCLMAYQGFFNDHSLFHFGPPTDNIVLGGSGREAEVSFQI